MKLYFGRLYMPSLKVFRRRLNIFNFLMDLYLLPVVRNMCHNLTEQCWITITYFST